jgi:RND family efflux transporter MFP subunit
MRSLNKMTATAFYSALLKNFPKGVLSYMLAKLFSVVFVPLGCTLLLVGCSKPVPMEEPVRSVKVQTVGMQSMESGLEFAGEVRARVESRLGFRVGGKLTERPVEVGQRVKVGQVLARIDPQDYKQAQDAARAQLASAVTNRDLTAAELKRFKDLRDQNFISSAELERREAAFRAAQAQYQQAQAQLSGQANQLSYATLVADAAGVVTAVEAEVGQVVAAGTPVVRLAQNGKRDVVFSVPEDKVAAIRLGSLVDVRVWGAAQTALKGAVREVAASADPVTRTFAVKVSIDSVNAPPLGATVTVLPQVFDNRGQQVIKLSTAALQQDGNGTAVWVLDPATMTVQLQRVQVSTADGNSAVIAAGLVPGQLVVVAGVHVLSPGQKVTIYQDKLAVSQANAQKAVSQSASSASPAAMPPPAPKLAPASAAK